MSLVGKINKNYVNVSNRLTSSYENTFGLYCDIYYPKNTISPDAVTNNVFTSINKDVNIFSPHQDAYYEDTPSVSQVKFYIPYLLKKESMNSSEQEFNSFYLENEDQIPFIETSKARELPISTKIVVYLESSRLYYWVDKKLVVNGADGHMLLRQYLAPLSEG